MDATACVAAAYLAIAVRFDDFTPFAQLTQWLPVLALPLAVRLPLNHVFGLYRHSWRHVSVPELVQLAVATAVGTALMVVVFLVLYGANSPAVAGMPRSFWILEGLFSFAGMGAVRLAPRILADVGASDSENKPAAAILYGAGDAGAMMARGAKRKPSVGISPVAFLDDDPRKWGSVHAGVKVIGGLDELAQTKRSTGAELLLITMPTAAGDAIRKVGEAAVSLGMTVRTVPSLDEMLNGTFQPEAIRPLRMEDLLRRPPVEVAVLDQLASTLRHERVLVTGAAGSIGSELARQLVALRPTALTLLDQAEGPLYELERELETRLKSAPAVRERVDYHLADITNQRDLARIVESMKPSVIFHAAAYKHVPMMEAHPARAIEVNVGGTLALLEAADKAGVNRFVLVSTDKAVDPSSVMGATKRLAELLVGEFSVRNGRPWVSVRFGNVLGSSGSVVPVFQKQLERGEPLTVTHEDMTRYFMTISEAIHLILQAATMARQGDLFVLDMGEPVRILDLAQDFLRLQGRDPARTPITITGLRRGEKICERLYFGHERVEATEHPKVRRVLSPSPGLQAHAALARQLVALAADGPDAMLRDALIAAVSLPGRAAETTQSGRGARAPDGRSRLTSEPASAQMK